MNKRWLRQLLLVEILIISRLICKQLFVTIILKCINWERNTVINSNIEKVHLIQGEVSWRDAAIFIENATWKFIALQWRQNEREGVLDHQPNKCLRNRLFRHKLKKTSKLRVTGLCVGNLPVTRIFPHKRPAKRENVSMWWRLHESSLTSDQSA